MSDPIKTIFEEILNGELEIVQQATNQALEDGVPASKILNEGMIRRHG